MAEVQFKVEIRGDGHFSTAHLIHPDTGEVIGELARCWEASLTDPAVLKLWKEFVKAAASMLLLEATAHLGGRISGWTETAVGPEGR